MNRPPSGWRSRFGGIRWQVTKAGVETEADGLLRTAGEPITMRRLLSTWGPKLQDVAIMTQVPLELLMMTVVTEGGLQWKGDHFTYPPLRKEPGYVSDDETPHRISFGPMHVLLSTYRSLLYAPTTAREEVMSLTNNIAAGALYIASTQHRHEWDPVLVAAVYNSGSVYDASSRSSRFHNRWHLRCHVNGRYVHVDRAARWYGDACAALLEQGPPPRSRQPLTPPCQEAK